MQEPKLPIADEVALPAAAVELSDPAVLVLLFAVKYPLGEQPIVLAVPLEAAGVAVKVVEGEVTPDALATLTGFP